LRLPACAVLALSAIAATSTIESQETERRYLSGHGPGDAVPWEFSVTGGRRAGEKTTIPVPSHWELQGFGTYNYGQEQDKGSERGHYTLRFGVPAEWAKRRVRLVFGGVMTDTTVSLNGQPAGPVHQGGFNQFRYDVSALLKFDAENVLEVEVAKVSANAATERAERGGDYWVFGGIYRPVWLEATPPQSIEQVAIDARADGTLTADVTFGSIFDRSRPDGPTLAPEEVEAQVLDAAGQPVGAPIVARIPGGGIGRLRLSTRVAEPRLWTAETPQLYALRTIRRRGGIALHSVTTRFGFRTFEVRAGEGLFLNGQRILLKGVNRHSFRPQTGRSLTREDAYADVRLIRSLNMNAVRMSHYAPDPAFLEACDELGLYVLDELSGWQASHDTAVGRLLVRELVERDVNHPSILFWDNGNEGGWNRDLDGDFALYDPRQRPVLHPWDPFSGIDTRHYTSYAEHARRLRGPNLVMPTEILHGLYDGGMGAGLEDYWRAIVASPFGAGVFLWDLADEGLVRTDQGGRIDVFSTFAPDGLVGPHFEKEGSYYTVRDVWSPIQIAAPVLDDTFAGVLEVENRYDFISLARCRFTWRWLSWKGAERLVVEGSATGPDVAPHTSGRLTVNLPPRWQEADGLALTAIDPSGEALWTWTWPTAGLAARTAARLSRPNAGRPRLVQRPGSLQLVAGEVTASFDSRTGTLLELRRGSKRFALENGPRLTYARPPSANAVAWLPAREGQDAASGTQYLATPQLANAVEVDLDLPRPTPYGGMQLELSIDGKRWKTIYDGTRRPGDGTRYDFPPQTVAAVRVTHPRASNAQPATVKSVRVGYESARFPAPATGGEISSGEGPDPQEKGTVAWIEARGANGLERVRWTMSATGALRLDYAYTLTGDFVYHGITFDHAEDAMKSLHWLGAGPYRVWQNRLRGTWLGIHEIARDDQQPGERWQYPEFQGYRSGVRWARLDTQAGPLTFAPFDPAIYLRIGTPRVTHPQTTADFPAGDVSFLHAISGMGSKFKPPSESGPAAEPAKATGRYEGSILIQVR
jgi:Glycosyl hydrolases family 2, TIM barrel domain/Glycosyl hydrolases family 2, sugar binding domain/Beta galactosidase small chain/Glycosyl hydrolases family 2